MSRAQDSLRDLHRAAAAELDGFKRQLEGQVRGKTFVEIVPVNLGDKIILVSLGDKGPQEKKRHLRCVGYNVSVRVIARGWGFAVSHHDHGEDAIAEQHAIGKILRPF